MTEVSLVCLALAVVVLCFNHFRLSFKVKELEDIVNSHWAATQHECNGIWEAINGEEDGDE